MNTTTHLIINDYLAGLSLNALSLKYDISNYLIRKILVTNNITIRNRNESIILENQKRSKKLNQDYFRTINAHSAYILGFLAADGYITPDPRNSIKIALHRQDEDILDFIKSELALESDYCYYTGKRQNGESPVVELKFSSATIKQELAKYGIVNNKSKILRLPLDILPINYQLDYLRGFIDGDGTWNISQTNPRLKIGIGSIKMLEDISEYLLKYHDIPSPNIYKLRTIDSLEYNSTMTKRIINLLYCRPFPIFYGNRKYQRIKSFIRI